MNTGVLAQMASSTNSSNNGLASPIPGFASRRGGHNIKPLTFDGLVPPADMENNMLRTPRTSRSHLLQGLRTAPKTSTAATFPASPLLTGGAPSTPAYPNGTLNLMPNAQNHLRPLTPLGARMSQASLSIYQNAPKSALPAFTAQPVYPVSSGSAQYTVDQVLAPPGISLDDSSRESMDPGLYAQMLATNIYLAQQRQHLQQQLINIQAAAQHFQGLGLSPVPQLQHFQQQPLAIMNQFQQQQQQQQAQQQFQHHQLQLQQIQQQQLQHQQHQQLRLQLQLQQQTQHQHQQHQYQQHLNMMHQAHSATPPTTYAYLDSTTYQPAYAVEQSLQAHMGVHSIQGYVGSTCALNTPLVQILPPSELPSSESLQPQNQPLSGSLTPKRFGSPVDSASLPPQSGNSFRRTHNKVSSLVNINGSLTTPISDAPRSAGPKLAVFSPSPLHGGYGPGQARAGEHPIRQPRGPPSLDDLVSKPTAKYEGSKNFSARARRFAVHNLVRAGMIRRKGTNSSSGSASRSGSISYLSEGGDDASTPVTDDESDSHSCSDSLTGETRSSRTDLKAAVNSAWGAIGSDRPSSRQKLRQVSDSNSGVCFSDAEGSSSFADFFKNSSSTTGTKVDDAMDVRRKAPMLVLTSADKRKPN